MPKVKVAPGPIPAVWIHDLVPRQKRIICHWTVTDYDVDMISMDSYHFIIRGDGGIERGNRDIDEPAPHTYMFNSAIGISMACMGGWDGEDTPYPPTKEQWDTLVNMVRQLCNTYNIPVERSSVLMHGEVHAVLGVDQAGKWDIGWLPHLGLYTGTASDCGNELRRLVLGGDEESTSGNPKVSLRLQGSGVVLQGFLLDATTWVPLRPFVHWAAEAGYGIRIHNVHTPSKTYCIEDTNPNLAERKHSLVGGYFQIRDTGYVEARTLADWLGLDVVVEEWTKTKRIIVLKKRDNGAAE